VFPHESPKMLAPGLCIASQKPALPRWGFSHLGRQTERERIPKPRKNFRIKISQALLALAIPHSDRYAFPALEVP